MKKIITIVALISILALFGCTDRTASSSTEKNYIANKNSGKLHSISCDSLPYEKNRIYFETIEAAHAAGYTNHHKECMGNTADFSSAEKNYIANKNSGKLHSISCDSLPYEKNRIYFETIEAAHAAGYTNHHKECMGNTADFSSAEKNYIANKNNGKLHSISCDSLPYEGNRIYFETIEAAHAAGYTNHHKECMGS